MNDRERLLRRIQEEDFVVYETVLYLDGHPRNKIALAFYDKHRAIAKGLRDEYEGKYGPITIYANNDMNDWHWIDRPWPWEKEANC